MEWSDILIFFTPDDNFQRFFFTLIFGLVSLVVLGLIIFSKTNTWVKNWQKQKNAQMYTSQTELGSIHDLSYAIASWPEKLADILPSILIILGLLGTFIGLGIALKYAGIALDHSEGAIIGIDDTIKGLTEMVKSLGAKFKTSAWGILGYLLTRSFYSIFGFERRRMQWCISKANVELANKKQDEEKNRLKEISRSADFNAELLAVLNLQLKKQEAIYQTNSQTNQMMSEFVKISTINVGKMANAAEKMSGAALKVDSSSDKLISAIQKFEVTVETVLGKVRDNLEFSINKMGTTFDDNMQKMTQSLVKSTDSISATVGQLDNMMDNLTKSVQQTMKQVADSVNGAVKLQTKSATAFATISEALQEKIGAVTNLIEKMGDDIRGPLTEVSETGRKIMIFSEQLKVGNEKIANQFDIAIDDIKISNKNASQTISDSQDIIQTLNRLAETIGMHNAAFTTHISAAITEIQGNMKFSSSIAENNNKTSDSLLTTIRAMEGAQNELLKINQEILTIAMNYLPDKGTEINTKSLEIGINPDLDNK